MSRVENRQDGSVCVALIATHRREHLLLERALPSVLSQSRMPDKLLIVVDRDKDDFPDGELATYREAIGERCGDLPVEVLRNRRKPRRASGAWNSGLDQLRRDETLVPERCFVAILDDDDAWEPEHIRACLGAADSQDLSMVATGLIRHKTPSDQGHRHTIPEALDRRELFIRGQHIQGSNLFVRLDALLKAGGFDEKLTSCTDRDLCIRLSMLPTLRFGKVDRHTVHHYADHRPDRLSIPGSAAKLDGLTAFWNKYQLKFDAEAQSRFVQRADTLFGWKPPTPSTRTLDVPKSTPPPQPIDLIAGFVTDADVPGHVAGLLDDLRELSERDDIRSLKVVITENGPLPDGGERTLQQLVSEFDGLDIELVSIERQHADWAALRLMDTPDPRRHRLPIAVSRTVLQTYVARAAQDHPDSWAWILDDDKRLSFEVDLGDGSVLEHQSPDLGSLWQLRQQGVDVVIGPDTGAAPLPFTATLRVQLIDLAHHLWLLSELDPSTDWPDRSGDDAKTRRLLPDTYYDLSRSTEHLETPLMLSARAGRNTAGQVLQYIGSRIDRLRAGEPVFRALEVPAEDLAVSAAQQSTQRGGSAIFFNPQVLLEYPQTLARFGDRFVRRSDMLVTRLMRDQLGLTTVMHPAAAVRHDRSCTTPSVLDDVLWEDVLGYALYRACDELFEAGSTDRKRSPLLAWTQSELATAVRLIRKYIDERLHAFALNSWRTLGLAEAILHTAEMLKGHEGPWAGAGHGEQLQRIIDEMDRVARQFQPEAVSEFCRSIRQSVSDSDIRDTLLSMDGLINEYRATHSRNDDSRHASRERRARELLDQNYECRNLRLLGQGGEGVVFTDGSRVYKVFDILKRRPNHDALSTLRELAERLGSAKHLYPITHFDSHDEMLVLVYPYEPSKPYTGGAGSGLIGLLRECRALGITFRNMHPKNLRVAPSGLKLIDFGSDIRPFTEEGFRSMAQRAYLSWRWPHREDLDQVMRRALTDDSLPELDGFDRFWTVLNDTHPSATRTVAALVDPLVLERESKSVLDYGCGKKARSSLNLAHAGLAVTGFDPGENMDERWARLGPLPENLRLTRNRPDALADGPFDAVVCSLVLCELGDGPEYEQVLKDLRASVVDKGLVVVTVCDPFATFGGPTPLHRRRTLPDGVAYEDAFWLKEQAETGSERTEFHRPLRRLERDLLRHGLRVERRVHSETVDLERFEPASDFLTLVCRPVCVESPDRSVSLLIKTCAMESATIERQVEHLTRQLEGPRTFAERVLAVDSRRDAFLRQHAEGDWDALMAAIERLERRGLIDRVVYGPERGSEAARINREWFDIESEATHTQSGVPLATPLWAFEACRGDYILQVDSDLLIGRRDPGHDYLGEMVHALEHAPRALTVSLDIAKPKPTPYSAARENGSPWRVEVRGCLFHRQRLLDRRPYANAQRGGVPELAWHRAMDESAKQGRFLSLRGGSSQTYFVHPPNELKRNVPDWMLLLDLVEKGHLPTSQQGSVELTGGPLDWVPRERHEPYVFMLTGRNVPPGRALRCLDSLMQQRGSNWGAVVIDDGSSEHSREHLRLALQPWRDRITLLQPRERRGQMANMTLAIRHICTNPESVIVTLDLDDALLGTFALERVEAEYAHGADVTVGSMLRTDKHAEYKVCFENPRGRRGGNVWQHLRSFRKRLFDAIPDWELRVDGRYFDIAVDWAYMLPIVELAEKPAWIREPLYLYEASGMGKREGRANREAQIGSITRRPRRRTSRGGLLEPEAISSSIWPAVGGLLVVRHAERRSLRGLTPEEKHAAPLTEAGRQSAMAFGTRIGSSAVLATSPVPRALETAWCIAQVWGSTVHTFAIRESLDKSDVLDHQACESVRKRLGCAGLLTAWLDGSLPPNILPPCAQVASDVLGELTVVGERGASRRLLAVTHDSVISVLLEALRGERRLGIPYLGGMLIEWPEVANFLTAQEMC